MSKPTIITYNGPWKGLNVQKPENIIGPDETPNLQNFLLRNSELRSRPTFRKVFRGPNGNDPVLGGASFLDAVNSAHSVTWTSEAMWQLVRNNQTALNPWQFLGPVSLTPGIPVSWQDFNTTVYFTNGGPVVYYWDGILNTPQLLDSVVIQQEAGTGVAQVSGSIGGLYLYEMNDSLCIANTTEFVPANPGTTSTQTMVQGFPQRIRWSANGIPNIWDPTVNISAGFEDLVEVPDNITGVLAIGSQIAYIFRTNGITEQTLTGSGALPFDFNHLWGSQRGIGNVFPWSISSYGSVGFFISNVDIYQVSVYNFEEIGSKPGARDAIRQDLANAQGNSFAAVLDLWNPGYVWLTYVIAIPLPGGMKVWIYSIEEKNWTNFFVSGYQPTAVPVPMWM